jgi:hypothetical protein
MAATSNPRTEEPQMSKGQPKQYRTGQKKPGGAIVKSTTMQGVPSGKQGGKTHQVKNRSVSHGRNK